MSKHSNRFMPDTHVIIGGRPCHFAKQGMSRVERLDTHLLVTLDLSDYTFVAPVEKLWELYVDVDDIPPLHYTDVSFVMGLEDNGVLIPRVVLRYEDSDALPTQKHLVPKQHQTPKIKH